MGSVVLNMNSGGVNTDVVLGSILHANNQGSLFHNFEGEKGKRVISIYYLHFLLGLQFSILQEEGGAIRNKQTITRSKSW